MLLVQLDIARGSTAPHLKNMGVDEDYLMCNFDKVCLKALHDWSIAGKVCLMGHRSALLFRPGHLSNGKGNFTFPYNKSQVEPSTPHEDLLSSFPCWRLLSMGPTHFWKALA